jgi:hypothetical protein
MKREGEEGIAGCIILYREWNVYHVTWAIGILPVAVEVGDRLFVDVRVYCHECE